MKKITFKIFNDINFLHGIYERPEEMGIRVMNLIIDGSNFPYRIYSDHEIEMIWFYDTVKNLPYSIEVKRKKLKSLFSVLNLKDDKNYMNFLNKIENFNFDTTVEILLEKENSEWKDISTLDLNSDDIDISSWGGLLNYSSKICYMVLDLIDEK